MDRGRGKRGEEATHKGLCRGEHHTGEWILVCAL